MSATTKAGPGRREHFVPLTAFGLPPIHEVPSP